MKEFWKRHKKMKHWLKVIGVSMVSSCVVVAIVGATLWHYRGRIIAAIVAQVPVAVPTVVQAPPAVVVEPAPVIDESPKDLTVTEVVAKVNKSVVSIEVSVPASGIAALLGEKTRTAGGGSGFFVSSNGLIMTNRHVVDRTGATFVVITADGTRYPATIVDRDPVYDLAVLKVQGSGFTPIPFGDSETLDLGQSVIAIGFALGEFKNSVSVGVISGLSRSITASGGGRLEFLDKVIQTDAAINPGNSGGPLLNLRGEVIGVNVAMASGSQSIGFAVPAKSASEVVASIKKTGSIVRPFVGIRYQPLTAELKRLYGITATVGIVVVPGADGSPAVQPGSPAAAAGIIEGDVIISVNGTLLDEKQDFASIIRSKAVGSTVSFEVLRQGVLRTVKLTLVKA